MSKMMVPEMKVVRFKGSDVIATSGATTKSFTLSMLGDGTKANGVLDYNGTQYTINSSSAVDNILNILGCDADTRIAFNASKDPWGTLSTFLNQEVKSGISNSGWNNTYVYDSALNRYIGQ